MTFINAQERKYYWEYGDIGENIQKSIDPPNGYSRITNINTFGEWIRNLPLKPESESVTLFNGQKKFNQLPQFRIIDIDVGNKDLQQCADAVIRLRSEYLYSMDLDTLIHFNYTSGDRSSWVEWRKGLRPNVNGNTVSWSRIKSPDDSYSNFKSYLENVFMYAGSASLERELTKVENPLKIQIGDVFIEGGSPGHAIIVVDIATNKEDEKVFLIAQSYMPAQSIHILKNPNLLISPWYKVKSKGKLITPEWIFDYDALYRF